MSNSELKAEALELFNAKEYAKSLELYLFMATQGDLSSLATVGYFYHNGLGVDQNYHKAIEYYKKAADAGEHSSAYNLGLLYFRGLGVEKNSIKAQEYYLQAAIKGMPQAQFDVALMFENGEGCSQNHSEAAFGMKRLPNEVMPKHLTTWVSYLKKE